MAANMALFPRRFAIGGLCQCRCARCSIAGRASRRRSASPSSGDLSGARAPPPPGAPLHAAHPCRHARSRAHHAAARQPQARRSEFAQKHGGWIAARLGRLPEAAPFAHGATLPLRGVDAPHRAPAAARAARSGSRPATTASALLCVAGDGAACRAPGRAIFSSARPSAISKRRAAARGRALGVTIKRVSVRDQSSRWGSCSTTGVLSYSWRLILAPPFVLDYLAAHEVAHLVEMNHSRAVLAAGRAHLPATSRAPRPGSTSTAPTCTATACRATTHAARRWRGARIAVVTRPCCVPAPSR